MRTGEGTLFLCKTNKRIAELERLAGQKGLAVHRISSSQMDRMCPGNDHKGALFVQKASKKKLQDEKKRHYRDLKDFLQRREEEKNLLVLLLDGISDPHNLGAILRSADQFAVDLLILPEKRSASINTTVARVSVGAHAWVPVIKCHNALQAAQELRKQGFWIYGADMDGKDAARTDLKGRCCLVLGSEGKGISRLLKEKCDALVGIPTAGHVDSLNVSVAAGILMYEVQRQRGQ